MSHSLNGNLIVLQRIGSSQYKKLGVNEEVFDFMKKYKEFSASYRSNVVTYSARVESQFQSRALPHSIESQPFIDVFDEPETFYRWSGLDKLRLAKNLYCKLSDKSPLILRVGSGSHVDFGNSTEAIEVYSSSLALRDLLRKRKNKIDLAEKDLVLLFDNEQEFYTPRQFKEKIIEAAGDMHSVAKIIKGPHNLRIVT